MSIPVDMGNVHAMGAQFKNNIFEGYSKKALRTGKRLGRIANATTPTSPATSATPAPSVTVTPGTATKNAPGNMIGAGKPVKVPAGIGPGKVTPALPVGQTKAPAGGFATPHTMGATPHSMAPSMHALPSGRKPIATPYQMPIRTIPMSGNAALTNRVNPTFAFSDQTSHSPINRTAFNQPSQTPFKVNTVQNPTPTAAPKAQPAQQFSSAPKPDYPLHVPPAGSSTQVLPRLTAAQSEPGRPNTFVVGSRNAKAGGIAAMGSQLESWAQSRQAEIRASRKS